MTDPNAGVREEALRTLSAIDDERVLEPLINSLKDPEERVREVGMEALVRWSSPAVARRLVESLTSPALRRPASELLARMGRAAVNPLVSLLREGHPDIAATVGETLERLVGRDVFLQRLGSMDPNDRLGAVEALGAMGGPEAVDTRMPIRRQANHTKRALGRLIRLGAAVAAPAVIAGQRHVLEHAEPVKRPRDLEGAADAAIDDAVRSHARDLRTVEQDRSRRRHQRARQHVEDRALAGAVRADQAENLALLHPERHVIDSGEATKTLHQPFYSQHARTSAYSFAGFTGC